MDPIFLYTRVPHSAKPSTPLMAELSKAKIELLKVFSTSHPFEEEAWFTKEMKGKDKWRLTRRKDSILLDKYPFTGEKELDRISFVICVERHGRDNPSKTRSRFLRSKEHAKFALSKVLFPPLVRGISPVDVQELVRV